VAVADCDEADFEDAFRFRYEGLCRFHFVSVFSVPGFAGAVVGFFRHP
jgi:hypothetical protein